MGCIDRLLLGPGIECVKCRCGRVQLHVRRPIRVAVAQLKPTQPINPDRAGERDPSLEVEVTALEGKSLIIAKYLTYTGGAPSGIHSGAAHKLL